MHLQETELLVTLETPSLPNAAWPHLGLRVRRRKDLQVLRPLPGQRHPVAHFG